MVVVGDGRGGGWCGKDQRMEPIYDFKVVYLARFQCDIRYAVG